MGTTFWIRGVVVAFTIIIGVVSVVILQTQSNAPRGATRIFETVQVQVAPQPVPTFTPIPVATATFTPIPTQQPTPTIALTPTIAAVVSIHPTAVPAFTPVVVEPVNTPPAPPDTTDPNFVCNEHYTEQQDKEACWWRWHNGFPLMEQATPTPSIVALPSPTPTISIVLPTPTPAGQPFAVVQPSSITYKIRPDSDILRELFRDKRFQDALHHSINCNEINHAVYHGHANPQQICKDGTQQYNLDTAHHLLDELGLEWDEHGVFRLRPDGRRLAWNVESFNNNQQTNDILKLCQKYFETIGIDMYIKQVNNPSASIPSHTVSTTSIGSKTCTDWIPVFAQSPKAPCTTTEEKQYLLALMEINPNAQYFTDHLLPIFNYSWDEIAEGTHYILESEKYLHKPMSEFIQKVKQFEQLTYPSSLKHIHSHRENMVKLIPTIHDLIYKALAEFDYSHINTATSHIETLANEHDKTWGMIVQTCDIPPPGWKVDNFGDYDFFGDLD